MAGNGKFTERPKSGMKIPDRPKKGMTKSSIGKGKNAQFILDWPNKGWQNH